MTALMSLVIGVVGWRLASWSFSCVILPALVLSFLQPITVVYVNTILLLWGHEVLYKIVDRNSFYAKVLRHPVLYYTCHAVTYFACGVRRLTSSRCGGVALSQLFLGSICTARYGYSSLCFCSVDVFDASTRNHRVRCGDLCGQQQESFSKLVTNFSVEIQFSSH